MLQSNFSKADFNIISRETSLEGQFTFAGDTIIYGKVFGQVKMLNGAKLVIEKEAYVEGEISGENIEVFGSLKGNFHFSQKSIIRPTGLIEGSLNTHQLVIEPGAVVNLTAQTQNEKTN